MTMATKLVKATVRIYIECDDGSEPTENDVKAAKAALHDAIWKRLFGEGFLPDWLNVETWEIVEE